MATRIEAYVDTSALIAFADRSDSYHPLFRRLLSDPLRLITTTLVIAEGHGWFLKRYDRTKALQFLAMIETMRPLTYSRSALASSKPRRHYYADFRTRI